MKVIDAYIAEEGYEKISKHLQLETSTVRNVIKKCQLRGTVDVKTRSERPRKLSDKPGHQLDRKAK